MNEKEPNAVNPIEPAAPDKPQIIVNQYGQTKDPAVVVDDRNRTVLLTPDETLVIEKEPLIDIVPKNRPRTVYAGMWGRNEIVTAGMGVFALLVVALIYFFLVIPSNREVARHQSEVENLKENKSALGALWGDAGDTQEKVVHLISSEESFETTYLPAAETGRNALYQRLNGLIDSYGLTNTSGPDYAPLETINQGDNNNQSEQERGREKFRSLFPGVYVSMTVEGSYQNLRRFIKDIETGNEFIVISAVQLEPSDSEKQTTEQQPNQSQPQPQTQTQGFGPYARPNQPTGPAPRPVTAPPVDGQTLAPKGKTKGEVVSLHLEMAAYFRRPNFEPSASR